MVQHLPLFLSSRISLQILYKTQKSSQETIILKTFSNHQVNSSNIESLKLNRTERGQIIAQKLTVEYQKFCLILDDLKRSYVHEEEQVPCVPWYPRNDDDLKTISTSIPLKEEIIQPEYTDQEYKKRREEIGLISKSHMIGEPIPIVGYLSNLSKKSRKSLGIQLLNILQSNLHFHLYSVQPFYAYTESLDEAMQKLIAQGKSLQKPFELYYSYYEQQIKSTTRIKTHQNEYLRKIYLYDRILILYSFLLIQKKRIKDSRV